MPVQGHKIVVIPADAVIQRRSHKGETLSRSIDGLKAARHVPIPGAATSC